MCGDRPPQKELQSQSFFSLTSFKCDVKPLSDASKPSVNFGVDARRGASTARFSFTFNASCVSDVSFAFDLHCSLDGTSDSSSTEIDRQLESNVSKSGITFESASKNDVPDKGEDCGNEVTGNQVSASASASIPGAGEPTDGRAITEDSERTNKCDPSLQKDETSTPVLVSHNSPKESPVSLSSLPTPPESVRINPLITGRSFIRNGQPYSSACEVPKNVPVPGSPLSWRPWIHVNYKRPEQVEVSKTGHPRPLYSEPHPYNAKGVTYFDNICCLPENAQMSPEELRLECYGVNGDANGGPNPDNKAECRETIEERVFKNLMYLLKSASESSTRE